MKRELKSALRSLPFVFMALLIVVGVSYAGSLTSPSTMTSQSYTLSDIYNKMMNITYSPATHSISTTTVPAPSFRTLTEIYNKLNTEGSLITPENIKKDVTMFGVTGSYVGSGGNVNQCGPGALEISPVGASAVNHTQGIAACAAMSTIGGSRPGVAWRVPTLTEMSSIINLQYVEGQNLGLAGPNGSRFGFITSTNDSNHPGNMYYAGWNGASVLVDYVSPNFLPPVLHYLCVR